MELPKPLKCSEVASREVLAALLRNELEAEEEDRVLAHLRRCPDCLSVVADILYKTDILERKIAEG